MRCEINRIVAISDASFDFGAVSMVACPVALSWSHGHGSSRCVSVCVCVVFFFGFAAHRIMGKLGLKSKLNFRHGSVRRRRRCRWRQLSKICLNNSTGRRLCCQAAALCFNLPCSLSLSLSIPLFPLHSSLFSVSLPPCAALLFALGAPLKLF